MLTKVDMMRKAPSWKHGLSCGALEGDGVCGKHYKCGPKSIHPSQSGFHLHSFFTRYVVPFSINVTIYIVTGTSKKDCHSDKK
jgi:hypothetical protein